MGNLGVRVRTKTDVHIFTRVLETLRRQNTGTRRRGVRRREPAGKPGGDGPAGGGHRGGREAEGFRRSKEGGGDWERKGGTRPNFGGNSDVFDGFSWTALPLASDGHTNKKMMRMH